MDFKNGEKARMTINNWVEQKTLKKIRYPGRYDEHEQRNQIGLLWKHLDHTKKDNFYVKRDKVNSLKGFCKFKINFKACPTGFEEIV